MIDWARLRELEDSLGAEGLAELVDVFMDEIEEGARRVGSSESARSSEEAFHFLRGSALNLGLAGIAELCQQGERIAGSGDDIAPFKARLSEEVKKTCAMFRREWRQHIMAPQ